MSELIYFVLCYVESVIVTVINSLSIKAGTKQKGQTFVTINADINYN